MKKWVMLHPIYAASDLLLECVLVEVPRKWRRRASNARKEMLITGSSELDVLGPNGPLLTALVVAVGASSFQGDGVALLRVPASVISSTNTGKPNFSRTTFPCTHNWARSISLG
jgi:hypothetical protein